LCIESSVLPSVIGEDSSNHQWELNHLGDFGGIAELVDIIEDRVDHGDINGDELIDVQNRLSPL
jgi:hypothetical protein